MTAPVHRDSFTGRCIHGVEGARYIDGRRVSPTCEHCKAKEEYLAIRKLKTS